MEKEFLPYELAVKLKELGFDEPCFGWYAKRDSVRIANGVFVGNHGSYSYELGCYAPIWQQAFDWFRDKHSLVHSVNPLTLDSWCYSFEDKYNHKIHNLENNFKTYEEARQACLEKLIELISK